MLRWVSAICGKRIIDKDIDAECQVYEGETKSEEEDVSGLEGAYRGKALDSAKGVEEYRDISSMDGECECDCEGTKHGVEENELRIPPWTDGARIVRIVEYSQSR